MIKNIIGYEGLYVINDSGNDNETVFGIKENGFLTPYTTQGGYKKVILSKNGVAKTYQLHRLIAEAFVPNLENKLEVDHIIPISSGGTNEVSNLRWATHTENMNNPLSLENKGNSQRNNPLKSFKVYQYEKDGTLFRVWESVGECARNGYNKGHVAACCRGILGTHKGYRWSYTPL